MKLLFIYEYPHEEFLLDGLHSAIEILEKDFKIEKMNLAKEGRGGTLKGYDFILGHGAFGSGVDLYLQDDFQKDNIPRGLCIAGNATEVKGADRYQILFYETDWVNDNYLPSHPNKVKAFGINTQIFHEVDIPMPIVWDYIGVGALANWKRWEYMLKKSGSRLVVGEYQEDNEQESLEIVKKLLKNSVMVSPMVHPFDLSNFYHWSRTLYIAADIIGGGERSVLEAKSCGLEVMCEEDNPKLQELIDLKKVPDHIEYAKILKKAILKV